MSKWVKNEQNCPKITLFHIISQYSTLFDLKKVFVLYAKRADLFQPNWGTEY